jgi:hypothetical protein
MTKENLMRYRGYKCGNYVINHERVLKTKSHKTIPLNTLCLYCRLEIRCTEDTRATGRELPKRWRHYLLKGRQRTCSAMPRGNAAIFSNMVVFAFYKQTVIVVFFFKALIS